MPGLTACLVRDLNLARFHAAQQTMLCQPDDECALHHVDGPVGLGTVGSPFYPTLRIRVVDGLVIQAGRIYNKTPEQIRRELAGIVNEIRASFATPSEAIRRWMLETDGEYNVAIALPNRLVIFTDPLGRLPLFSWADRSTFVVACEPKVILSMIDEVRYDPIGCAQHLWFRYPLGERTLWKNVTRVPAGALIAVGLHDGVPRPKATRLFSLNFDSKNDSLGDVRTAADHLAGLFLDACRKRAHGDDEILGLSGGHDSRAVAAGLARHGIPVRAVTGIAKGRQHAVEIISATQVARALGFEHHTYETPVADLAMHKEMIRINDGRITTANSSSISDLQHLRKVFGGQTTYISGDGGDKAMPDLRLPHRSRSLEELAFEIGRAYGSHGLPPEIAAKSAGLSKDDLYHDLVTLLASYPEQDLEQKGVHFVIYERARRFVFEGEDHRRSFLAWTTSPFFAWPFFHAAMRVPNRLKRDRRLYRHFLRTISPETEAIPLTNVGVGPGSPTYLARTWIRGRYDALPWSVRDRIKRRFKKPSAPAPTDLAIAAAIEESCATNGGVGSIIDLGYLGQVSDRHILTLALLTAQWPHGGKSSDPLKV